MFLPPCQGKVALELSPNTELVFAVGTHWVHSVGSSWDRAVGLQQRWAMHGAGKKATDGGMQILPAG